jgi:SAM-dependent methyltransferase
MQATLCCRSCASPGLLPVIDLGLQPLANNLLPAAGAAGREPFHPLGVVVCQSCWLMQITHVIDPEILYADYLYHSSVSDQMVAHARQAAAQHLRGKRLGPASFVVEVASNDGYLLKNVAAAGVPCLGIEPATRIAAAARSAGVETLCEYFTPGLAARLREERGPADLVLGNNVLAHAPDLNGFVAGLGALLKPDGWIVLEFPYALDMIQQTEFDTIYHEHVYYFCLAPLVPLFARHGLAVFHVQRLSIHGGSLRVYASHAGACPVRATVGGVLATEAAHGVRTPAFYQDFGRQAAGVKSALTAFLEEHGPGRKRIAAYGASAKGSTLLNYVGPPARVLEFIADRSPHKQGLLSPGLHLPIVPAEELESRRPDHALLLTWNFAGEILRQQAGYLQKGGRFVLPLPRLKVL